MSEKMTLRSSMTRASRLLERFLTPGLQYSQQSYEAELQSAVTEETDWLDLGCGHQVLPDWRSREERALLGRCRSIVGIDYDLPSLRAHPYLSNRIKGDASALPLRARSFDLVTANMVVEHLTDPVQQFIEVARVLKPGGRFLFHTMNVSGYYVVLSRHLPQKMKNRMAWILQRRAEKDVFPTHYRVNSKKRIQEVAAASGLQVETIRLIESTPQMRICPPLVLVELLWIRFIRHPRMEGLRTNLIAILRLTDPPQERTRSFSENQDEVGSEVRC